MPDLLPGVVQEVGPEGRLWPAPNAGLRLGAGLHAQGYGAGTRRPTVFAGFGNKAGLMPRHFWLRRAHPEAPTPASAVLPGAMAKAGIPGVMRFLPEGRGIGPPPVVPGLPGAFAGALPGLTQENPVAILASSTVSKMSLAVALFHAVEEREAIRPNVPVVLRSPEWVLCGQEAGDGVDLVSVGAERGGLAAPGQGQLACRTDRPEAASSPPCNPYIHALDTSLTAFESGQPGYWAPDLRDPLGSVATGFADALTLAGWALSLLAVAGFPELVRST